MKLRFFAIVLCLVPAMCLAQVKSTTVKGKIADATTGEALPFVQVYFDGTQIGTTTDIDGRYQLKNDKGHGTVIFKMMGYKTEVKSVQYGSHATLNVEMRPAATQLAEVKITPKEKKRERYRRRDNPAVELARNVIQHKWMNRMEANNAYERRQYRKVTLALDNFDPDFDSSHFWNKYSFVQQYIDYTQPTNPCLGFSLREVASFAMLYGGLSPQNNPEGGQAGLYRLPDGCGPLGTTPYMECSVGLENIFRFIRLDYVWRLSYAHNIPQNQRGVIRIGFRFAL